MDLFKNSMTFTTTFFNNIYHHLLILQRAKLIREENKTINLHTVIYRSWDVNEIKLKHLMTFKTLAMDSELKKAVMEDLENFMNGEEYYKSVGKA